MFDRIKQQLSGVFFKKTNLRRWTQCVYHLRSGKHTVMRFCVRRQEQLAALSSARQTFTYYLKLCVVSVCMYNIKLSPD